ncbi:sugar ABC transporter substrate-binding protein [Micromonospora yasonensis]|uniref:ABC transporter substrate-binding protein n=1 Tax=Micromonospora yasonensis TaxID=1128667 RepID=UPI0022329923|nr:sugar ABC transporter substrate-binding protein [Micromonospora yasonensis]MCW3840689.1 sugar ABC transporter substrate-binding protein [Micromonospora yasonensis]
MTILRTSRPLRRWRIGMTAMAAALAVASLSLAGCGGGSGASDGTTKLTFASWDAAEPATRQSTLDLVKQFETEHPNIKVSISPIPFSDIEQKVLLQVQSGSAPDVVQTASNYTADFNAAGALEPLDTRAGQDYLAEIPQNVADVSRVDGKLVAVPWAVQPVGFWYNKKLMAQAGLDPQSPPKTIDELLTDLKAIKAKLPGVIPLGVDSTNRVFGLDVNWSWMRTFGAEPIASSGAQATTPEMANYLNFMRTLATEHYTEVNQKIGYFRPLAAQNKVAFSWDQPILEPTMKSASKMDDKTFQDTWGVTTLPAGPGGQKFSVPQDHQLAIMKSSKAKDAAWTFIQWMTRNEKALNHVVADKGALPPVSKPSDAVNALVEKDSALKAFRDDVAPTMVRPPWGPKYAKAYDPIMVGVQQMMTGNQPVTAVADEMQSKLQGALQ